jgi:hypothetical protein
MGHRYCELYEMSKVKFEIRMSKSETIPKKKSKYGNSRDQEGILLNSVL